MVSRDLEEYLKWEKERSSWLTNFMKNVQPIHVIGFGILIVLAIYLVDTQKLDKTVVFVVAGVIIAAIIFKSKQNIEKRPIPENIMKIIGEQLMRRKSPKEYPWGTKIVSAVYCGLKYEGEWGLAYRPWKWEIGYHAFYPNGAKKTLVVIFEPYEGWISRIMEKPEGYIGEDLKDLKVLLPMQMQVKEETPGEKKT